MQLLLTIWSEMCVLAAEAASNNTTSDLISHIFKDISYPCVCYSCLYFNYTIFLPPPTLYFPFFVLMVQFCLGASFNSYCGFKTRGKKTELLPFCFFASANSSSCSSHADVCVNSNTSVIKFPEDAYRGRGQRPLSRSSST